MNDDEIRQAVRDAYAQIARERGLAGLVAGAGCS